MQMRAGEVEIGDVAFLEAHRFVLKQSGEDFEVVLPKTWTVDTEKISDDHVPFKVGEDQILVRRDVYVRIWGELMTMEPDHVFESAHPTMPVFIG